MKRVIIVTALFAAACAEPQVAPYKSDAVLLPTVEVHATRELAEEPKPEPKPKAVIKLPTCKGIDTGDEKESFNLKLDCMLDGK